MANVNGKTGIRCRCRCVDIFQGTIAQGREVAGERKRTSGNAQTIVRLEKQLPVSQNTNPTLFLSLSLIPSHSLPSRRPSFCSIHIFVLFKFNFRSFNMPDMILVLFYIAIPYLPPLILHISQSHPAARHILNIKYDFQTLPWRKKKNDFELNFMSQQLRP